MADRLHARFPGEQCGEFFEQRVRARVTSAQKPYEEPCQQIRHARCVADEIELASAQLCFEPAKLRAELGEDMRQIGNLLLKSPSGPRYRRARSATSARGRLSATGANDTRIAKSNIAPSVQRDKANDRPYSLLGKRVDFGCRTGSTEDR